MGGTLLCWGYNQNGQLGNNPTSIGINENSPSPVAVTGLSGVLHVAAGKAHTCAAMATGGVKCWGAGWASGAPQSTNQLTPYSVSGF
jgi:alpha-tubulin suppressor-like RCC1 family protein